MGCLSLSASTALAKSDKYQCVALSQPIEKVPKGLTNEKPKGGWLSSDRVVGVGPTPIPNGAIENSSPQAKMGSFRRPLWELSVWLPSRKGHSGLE